LAGIMTGGLPVYAGEMLAFTIMAAEAPEISNY
jgi:hypothetical protein